MKREQEIYEREQEMTALYRQTLKAIREDAGEAVAEAVRSAVPAPADWEEIVRRVVREEMASAVPLGIDGPVSASKGDAGAKGKAGTGGDAATGGKAGSRPWPTWAVAVVGALTAVALVGAGWWAGRQWGPWPARAAGGGAGAPSVVGDSVAPLVDTVRAVLPDSLGLPDSLRPSDSPALAVDSSQALETDSALDTGPDSSGVEVPPEDVP